jgi:predicted DsbA family dithiol-disulfide isomerase
MHEALFAEPQALGATDLTNRARRLGLDQTQFADCLHSGETAEAVERDRAEGQRLNVNSTPVFFVGLVQAGGTIDLRKRINGAVAFEDFERVVRELRRTRRAEVRGRQLFARFAPSAAP